MPFCANCGSQVEGRFCVKCGAEVQGGAAVGAAPAAASAPQKSTPPTGEAKAAIRGMADNVASTLCYALGFITGILFLVVEPYKTNRVVRFHAFQSIFVHLAVIVVWILASMLMPWRLSVFLSPLISLASLGLWLYLMWKAYQGQKVVLPVIGELAQKQA